MCILLAAEYSLLLAVWYVAVTVCSTVSGNNIDKADFPSECYITIGAEDRY